MDFEIIKHYFPNINTEQEQKFEQLMSLYGDWNEKINVISRKDIGNLYINHVLHSLAIAKLINFADGSDILDIGTGGGFPGIPLSIMFPNVQFHLTDSIGKKIRVCTEISNALSLTNVKAEQIRSENVKNKYDFIVSRAVTQLPDFMPWTKGKLKKKNINLLPNGVLYLKGGDLENEIKPLSQTVHQYNISIWFKEEFFIEKKVLHIF